MIRTAMVLLKIPSPEHSKFDKLRRAFMDRSYEENIVRSLFVRRIQERIIHELHSPKKRSNAIHRLSHNYRDILVGEYMGEISKIYATCVDIFDLLRGNGFGEECYSISCNKKIDGKYSSLRFALEQAVGYGLPSLVVCTYNQLAYFEGEQERGSPPRFLIHKK